MTRRAGPAFLIVFLLSTGCGGAPNASLELATPGVAAAAATAVPPTPEPTLVRTSMPTATAPALQPTATQILTTPTRAAPTSTLVPTATPLPIERILAVPLHRQEHALSCEAAALKMAMGALGKNVAEDELLAGLARDLTPRVVRADKSVVWGDPDVGFVGKWDGLYLKDGYGVYDGPIAELALAYGFEKTTHAHGADPQRLYAAVRQGFPSVVWVPYSLVVKGRGAWITPVGKNIPYVVTEHAVVLAGVDEDGVYYADPLAPKLQYATFALFEAGLAELEYRAVVLRP